MQDVVDSGSLLQVQQIKVEFSISFATCVTVAATLSLSRPWPDGQS